jgi:thiamine biosynthesis protein ThiS
MKVTINGEGRTMDEGGTISQLLERLGVSPAGTAVAVNGTIVPRDDHDARTIAEGDAVEILRPIGGG